MRNYFLIVSFILLGAHTFCQSKEISVKTIYRYHVTKFLVKQDSLIKEYDDPLIETHKFYIAISKAFFDSKSKELRLIGRVCLTDDTLTCLGIPGVEIFKAIKDKSNILSSRTELAETSHNKDSLDKDGFFDFKFKIEKAESLLFFMPYFYLEEFKLGELMGDKGSISKKLRCKVSVSPDVLSMLSPPMLVE